MFSSLHDSKYTATILSVNGEIYHTGQLSVYCCDVQAPGSIQKVYSKIDIYLNLQ